MFSNVPRPLILSRARVLTYSVGAPFGQWTVDIDISTITETFGIPVGSYYNDSTTAAESLADEMKAQFDTHTQVGGFPFTVTYSRSTGLYTIARSANFTIEFNTGSYGTAFRDWIGFTGDDGPTQSAVSDAVAQGAIFPESGRVDFEDVDRETTASAAPSEGGVVAAIGSGYVRSLASWSHSFEPRILVASPLASGTLDVGSSQVPWTWEDWWAHHATNAIGKGEPMRYYTDLTGAITSYEDEYVLHENAVEKFDKGRVVKNWNGFWRVGVMVRSYVLPSA